MTCKRNKLALSFFLILALIACSKGGENATSSASSSPSSDPSSTPPTPPVIVDPLPPPVPPVINQAPAIEINFNGAIINTETEPEQTIIYKEGLPTEGLNIYIRDPDGDPVKFLSVNPNTFQFSPIECGDQNLVEARCHFTLVPPANVNDGDVFAIDIAATDEPKREGVAGIGVVKRFKIKFSKEAVPPPVPQNSPPQVTFVTPNPASSVRRIPYNGEVANFQVRVKDLDGHPIADNVKVQVVGEPGSRNPSVDTAIFQFHRELCNEPDRPGECLFSLTTNGQNQDIYERYRLTFSIADVPPEGTEPKVGSDSFDFQFENPIPPSPAVNRAPVIRFDIDPNSVPMDDDGTIHLPLFIGTAFGGFQVRVQDPDRDPIYQKLTIRAQPNRGTDYITFDPLEYVCESSSKVGECLFDMILSQGLQPGRYDIKVTARDVPTSARSGLPQKKSSLARNIVFEDVDTGPMISLRTLPSDSPHQFEWRISSITRFPVRDAAVFISLCGNPTMLFTVEYSGTQCKVNNEAQETANCLGPRTLDMTPYGSGRYCARIMAVDSAGRQVETSTQLILP